MTRRVGQVRRRDTAEKGAGWLQVRRSKYSAVPTVVDGFRFASRAEARRYGELKMLGLAGEIRNLELQPRFPLTSNGQPVAVYVGDFRYDERVTVHQQLAFAGETLSFGKIHRWRDVVEDRKGIRTPVYILKRKLFEAQYPSITFRETR